MFIFYKKNQGEMLISLSFSYLIIHMYFLFVELNRSWNEIVRLLTEN